MSGLVVGVPVGGLVPLVSSLAIAACSNHLYGPLVSSLDMAACSMVSHLCSSMVTLEHRLVPVWSLYVLDELAGCSVPRDIFVPSVAVLMAARWFQ